MFPHFFFFNFLLCVPAKIHVTHFLCNSASFQRGSECSFVCDRFLQTLVVDCSLVSLNTINFFCYIKLS